MRRYLHIGGELLVAIGVALGVLVTVSTAQSAETKPAAAAETSSLVEFHIIAEDNNGPWTYSENGRPAGFVVEIVEEIALRLGADQIEIEMQPWARAYHSLTTEPKSVLFSVGRTSNREELFQWVGPAFIHEAYLYARAGSGLSVNNLEDAKNLGSIGVHRSAADFQYLEQQGFTNLHPVTDDIQNVQKLLLGRIDAMPGAEREMHRRLSDIGKSPESIERLFTLFSAGIYIAFSLDVDPSVVERWQQTFDEMKSDGFIRRAEERWGLI